MRSPRIITTILACGLSAAACGTDSSPTAPGSAPPLRTEMSPPGPGALVFRGNGQFFATWRGDGSLVEIGASAQSIAQLCRTGDFESGVLLDHFVERPSGGESVTFGSDGKVPLLLFPESAEDICSAPPVAQGSGLYRDVVSNFLGSTGRGNSTTRFTGQVTDRSGQRRHVLVLIHTQLRRDGFHFITDRVKVN